MASMEKDSQEIDFLKKNKEWHGTCCN